MNEQEDFHDEDYRRTYKEYYRGDKRLLYECPDCKTPKSISAWHKKHGYHCDKCIKALEQGF